ncbi:2-oxoglutarate dehydrogenase, E2 component, dihydrolipoamide succinyltransferase, partial [Streptomyces scabiei]
APSGELPAVAPASLARIDVPPATQTAQPEPAQPVAAPAAPPLLARAVPTHVLPARLAPATPFARPAAPVIGTHVVQLGAF